MELRFRVFAYIAKPVHEVFEAVADPGQLSCYFTTGGAEGRLEEGATVCCYATSEKSWISDPDGVVWETFLTNGEATVYGESPALTALSDNAVGGVCCAPVMAPEPATKSCCG